MAVEVELRKPNFNAFLQLIMQKLCNVTLYSSYMWRAKVFLQSVQ